MRTRLLHIVLASVLIVSSLGCVSPGLARDDGAVDDDEGMLRAAISRIVQTGTVSERSHDDRLRAAAELAAIVPRSTRANEQEAERQEIINITVDELVRAGAGGDPKETFRTGEVYPMIQVAARIDDAQLLAGLLSPWLETTQKAPDGYVAQEIIRRADLFDVGYNVNDELEYVVVAEMLQRKLLDENVSRRVLSGLLARTSHNKLAYVNTWSAGLGQLGRLLGDNRQRLAVQAAQLDTLELAVETLQREEDVEAARELIVDLADAPHWLAQSMAMLAMREDALYDPRAVEILESRKLPEEIAGLLAATKRAREARGLPLDQTTPPSESRTM